MKVIRNSYNAGEISEYLTGRNDLAKYYNACSKLVNATVLPYGGAVKRSGTEFIARAKGECKLFKFEFSATDSMIIEAGNLYMRFYKNDDRVLEANKTIASITLTHGAAVNVEITGHGYNTGHVVRFNSITGQATELNYDADKKNEYVITWVNANNFTLNGTDGANFTDGVLGANSYCKCAHEIVTPYTIAEVPDVHMAASADVVYMAHTNHPQQKLSRVADNNWTIADVVFEGGPFLTENSTVTSLVGFARTGGTARSGYYFPAGATGTLTASGSGNAPFNANQVGALWLVKHTRPDNASTVTITGSSTNSTSAAIKTKGDLGLDCYGFDVGDYITLQRKEGNGEWQDCRKFSTATSYTTTEEADDVYYRMYVVKGSGSTDLIATLTAKDQNNYGIVQITGFTSTTVVSCTVIEPVLSDNSSDAAVTTSMWAEGSWSDYRGYPVAVTFHEDRLWWGGTTNNPQTFWGSKTGDYQNHTTGVLDDDAVIATIADNDVSNIQWITSKKVLIVGTSNKEYAVSGGSFDKPITPSAIKVDAQSSYGSNHLQPVVLNDGLFYAQRQGRKLRIMNMNEYGDQFQSDDATLLANHIFERPPIDMDVQRIPDPILWVVREDGELCLFTYEPQEDAKVAAWSRVVTGSTLDSPVAQFKSVKIIAGTVEDDVWVVVERIINSATVYYIEKFATRYIDQLDEALMLDCAKVVASNNESQDINLASDTVRYGSGVYGSSYYGGRKS